MICDNTALQADPLVSQLPVLLLFCSPPPAICALHASRACLHALPAGPVIVAGGDVASAAVLSALLTCGFLGSGGLDSIFCNSLPTVGPVWGS